VSTVETSHVIKLSSPLGECRPLDVLGSRGPSYPARPVLFLDVDETPADALGVDVVVVVAPGAGEVGAGVGE
jgi:hypothetical protein